VVHGVPPDAKGSGGGLHQETPWTIALQSEGTPGSPRYVPGITRVILSSTCARIAHSNKVACWRLYFPVMPKSAACLNFLCNCRAVNVIVRGSAALTALHAHTEVDYHRQKRASDLRTSGFIKAILFRSEASYDSKCAIEWQEMQVDIANRS
jgi:hypothetical protein